jgi:hypothetical protein
MKTVLIKISLIFLSVVLTVMIGCNTYMFIITTKLSQADGLFAKVKVITDFHILEKMWLGAGSMFLTVVLLLILFWFIVKEFVVKSKKSNPIN